MGVAKKYNFTVEYFVLKAIQELVIFVIERWDI